MSFQRSCRSQFKQPTGFLWKDPGWCRTTNIPAALRTEWVRSTFGNKVLIWCLDHDHNHDGTVYLPHEPVSVLNIYSCGLHCLCTACSQFYLFLHQMTAEVFSGGPSVSTRYHTSHSGLFKHLRSDSTDVQRYRKLVQIEMFCGGSADLKAAIFSSH